MKLLFKTGDELGHVLDLLCIHRVPCFGGLFFKLGHHLVIEVLQFQGTGHDIDIQLVQVIQILFIHGIQGGDVAYKLELCPFKLINNLLNLDTELVIARNELVGLPPQSSKQLGKALLIGINGINIQILNLDQKIGEHFSHLAAVLGPDLFQHSIGELGDIALCQATILNDALRIRDIDLSSNVQNLLTILGRHLIPLIYIIVLHRFYTLSRCGLNLCIHTDTIPFLDFTGNTIITRFASELK